MNLESLKIKFLKKIQFKYWSKNFADRHEIRVPKNLKRKNHLSTRGGANINIILELVNRTKLLEGDFAECGVYRGATLIPLAIISKERNRKVFAYDSFEGFDEDIEVDLKLGGADNDEKRIQGFDNTSFEMVNNKVKLFDVSDNVIFRKGYFKNTLKEDESLDSRFSFVHLDCDIYESYKTCLEYFWPRMCKGGIILFDEYLDPPWPGCKKAVDEFCNPKNIKIHEIIDNNYTKYYVQK